MAIIKSNHPLVLLLTGPTASGKSSLALHLAKALDAEIVSMDSMQIYRGMDLGTAKASPEEQRQVRHHLLDIRDPLERYSTAEFLEDAYAAIDDIHARGKKALLCGGTGQYATALLDGLLFPEEAHDPLLRATWEERLLQDGLDFWHAQLAYLDPEAGQRIKAGDKKRIMRFFEQYQSQLMIQSELHRESRLQGPRYAYLAFALHPPRSWLYERINARVEKLFAAGLLEELQGLLDRLPELPSSQAFQAIAYKEVLPALKDPSLIEAAKQALAQASRRYAKRQMSLLRGRKDIQQLTSIDPKEQARSILRAYQDASKRCPNRML